MVKVGPYEIDLVPQKSWGKSLSRLARAPGSGFRSTWDKVRDRELERCGYKCEICGALGQKGDLFCHEKWVYDQSNCTQRLTGYEVVCKDCNLILHMGRTQVIGLVEKAVNHFHNVTGLEKEVLSKAVSEAALEWRMRSAYSWKIDISSDPLVRRFEKQLNDLKSISYRTEQVSPSLKRLRYLEHFALRLNCRSIRTLFKVVRKAIIFYELGNLKQAKLYRGLVKREWGFMEKGKALPNDVKEKSGMLLQQMYCSRSVDDMDRIEGEIRGAIMEYLQKSMPLDVFSEFKDALSKQDKTLSAKCRKA